MWIYLAVTKLEESNVFWATRYIVREILRAGKYIVREIWRGEQVNILLGLVIE